MWQTLKQGYKDFEERQLAKLSELERRDVQEFDSEVKRRSWRYLGGFALLWLLSAGALYGIHPRLGLLESFLLTLVMIVAIGFGLISAWFGHSRYKGPLLKAALITVALAVFGAVCGAFIGMTMSGKSADSFVDLLGKSGPKVLIAGLVIGLVYAVFMVSVVRYRRYQLQQRNAELEAQARVERLDRSLTDARLKLMQAQVEPHFLFNTLASVKQLAENKAPEAAVLTGNLITFLRAGLTGLRGDQATLGSEIQMASAYLTIMQTRMGADRLQFSVDVPEELQPLRLPPAMLISLVENAIKHGLEPNPKGGSLHLSAAKVDGGVAITVADTGKGMSDHPGSGVGLANIRERLHALFRDQASLELAENKPHGFIARMVIPCTEQQGDK